MTARTGTSVPPGTRLGRYDVLSSLGAGGMGEVYRGLDTKLGREVALKVLPEPLSGDPDRLARFEREARTVSSLHHPNIVVVHEIARQGETAFIAMELVDGRTLAEVIASGATPPRRALMLAAQLADGLARAHEAGIVHRDLKPDNVMVTRDGSVKILDFGLARATPLAAGAAEATLSVDGHTLPGTVLGTVGYMSPEQASGLPVDFRSDQFAFGTLLHELLSGRRLWRRATAAETLAAIIREGAPPLPAAPRAVRRILDRCLAKDPLERYAATRDLARDAADARDDVSDTLGLAAALPARPRPRALLALAALALLAAGLVAGWTLSRASAPEAPAPPTFRRLTFRRGSVGNARFTPDGRTIIYGAAWAGDTPAVYLTRSDSPESRMLDFGPSALLSVSRNDELALRLTPHSVGTLAVAPLNGGTPRPRVESVDEGADWTPDGRDLAAVRTVDERRRLEFPIGHVLVPDGVTAPRFSPSGDRIAFFETASSDSAVSVIGARGESRRVLSAGWKNVVGSIAWTANGGEIWFTAAEKPGEPTALWSVGLSGRRRLVLRAPGALELHDLARDGRALVGSSTLQGHLQVGAVGGEMREISWFDRSMAADLAADGRTVLVNELGESFEDPTMYLRSADGSPPVRLSRGTGFALSPHGRWVLAARPGAEAGLLLVPTGTGETRPLAAAGLRDHNWGAWLPGGDGVVFSATDASGRSRVYVQSLDNGAAPRPISPDGTWIASFTNPVSPDGRSVVVGSGQFAWTTADHAIYPVDGAGPARPVPGLERGEVVIQWSADSRSLYFIRIGDRPMRVGNLDLDTGKRTVRGVVPADASMQFFRVRITPDGRTWAYGGQTEQSTLYLVEGLR